MSSFTYIKRAPLMYVNGDGEFKKVTVQPIKGVNIPNSFDIPFVRGAVGLFNVIISRMMYFSTYDAYKNERKYQKAKEYIYLPAYQISEMINRCESQSYNIIRSLERIFGIYVTRAHEQHGANTFMLSDRVNEFLHIFTYKKLNEFIKKYNIEPVDQYALKQVYNYRVVRPTDSNLDREEREEFHQFIKSRKHRNFLHFCAQNNVSPQARVEQIEAHIDFLNSKQREQLQSIKSKLKKGVKKLQNYFHWKLIDLQQFISMMIKKAKVKVSKSNQEANNKPSLGSNRNKTKGEQRMTEEVAAAHKKEPDDPSFQDIVQIATFWNIIAADTNMEFMNSLTSKNIQSIKTLVKYHGKDKVLQAVENTSHLLKSDDRYPLTFKSFSTNSTDTDSTFNKILLHDHFDSRLDEDAKMLVKNKVFRFKLNVSPVSHDNVPSFNSKEEANTWFKSHLNQM